MDISEYDDKYSIDFVCNNGDVLNKSMYDYAINLNINSDVKEILIRNNAFKDNLIFGDYVLTSPNSGNVLAKTNFSKKTTDYNITTYGVYGENATVTVKVNDSATGTITVKVDDGQVFTGIIDNGVVNIILSNLSTGVHNLIISYSGDDDYLQFNTTANLTVSKNANYNMSISTNNITVVEDEVIKVNLPIDANGLVIINLNGANYLAKVEKGIATLIIKDLKIKNYSVTAFYSDINYELKNVTSSFVVNGLNPNLAVDSVSTTKDSSVDLIAHLDLNATGFVIFYINDTKVGISEIENGIANYTYIPTNVGNFFIKAVYKGDDVYFSSNASANLTVNNATGSFNVGVGDIVYGDGFIIDVANATGVNGILLNGTVDVTVDGNVYSFNVTDGAGSYEVSDILPAGKYVVNASLLVPNYNVMIVNTSFIVTKAPTKFIDATSGTVYNGKYYGVRLTDNSGKALASKNVAIKIAGKTYNVKTDKNGLAKVKIALTSKYLDKSLTVTYKFLGDNNLKANSGSSNIKVIKTPTKINNATKLVVKNHKNFYVKLTTKSGKVLANKVITMKSSVSSKIYKIKTNSKGIAKIDLWVKNKPLGKYYKYLFKFKGDNYYKACTKTFKIKIIK